MLKKTSLRLPLLSLGLLLLLAGWTACKPAADKDGTAATPGADSTAASASGPTSQGSPAAPGQPAAGTPGDATSTQPANPADAKPMVAKDMPEVIAKVNSRTVTRDELLQASQMMQIQLAQARRPVTPTQGFYRQVLDIVINNILLQQDAKASGVTATDQEVQQQLAARKGSFPDEATYKKALAQAGLTEEKLREQTRDQLAIEKYVKSRFAEKVNITDQATREFYDKNKSNMQAPERVRVRHILIRFDPKGSPSDKEKAREKAANLLKRAQEGEDFAKLVSEDSEDPRSKATGGEDWVTQDNKVPTFEKAAFALKKPNDLSPVVESQYGFHIIQFLEHQDAGTLPYEQVKGRIGMLLQQEAQQQLAARVQARVRELRSKAKVEVFL